MKMIDLLAGNLERNLGILKHTLADFTDTEMLVRPCPAANHALWQIGHLIRSETALVNVLRPGAMPELPAGFAERFSNEASKVDDPARLSTKADLLALLEKTRAASVRWARSLSEADLDQPTPERMRPFAPTVADLALGLSQHTMMHLGQIQAIRRKLGKPILF